jgi:hypothetical protein
MEKIKIIYTTRFHNPKKTISTPERSTLATILNKTEPYELGQDFNFLRSSFLQAVSLGLSEALSGNVSCLFQCMLTHRRCSSLDKIERSEGAELTALAFLYVGNLASKLLEPSDLKTMHLISALEGENYSI